MTRDSNLVKRNLLALPGAVLTFYSLAGLVYVLGYRVGGICDDPHRFLVGGACYGALPFLTAILLVGIILLGLGLVLYRGRPEYAIDHLQAGTPTHMAVTLLASLVVMLSITSAVLLYLESTQGFTFGTQIGNFGFKTPFLFELGALFALAALIPVLGLLAAQAQRRRSFLRAAQEEADMETEFPGAPPREPGGMPPEEFVDESQWPAGREAQTVQNR